MDLDTFTSEISEMTLGYDKQPRIPSCTNAALLTRDSGMHVAHASIIYCRHCTQSEECRKQETGIGQGGKGAAWSPWRVCKTSLSFPTEFATWPASLEAQVSIAPTRTNAALLTRNSGMHIAFTSRTFLLSA